MSVCFGLKDPLKLVRGVQLVSGGAKDLDRLEITSPVRVIPIFCISSGFGKDGESVFVVFLNVLHLVRLCLGAANSI